MRYESITVMGPTASGKTSVAVKLARAFQGEIISGDSRQVYRGMDLGTGKDLEEYGEIPYHLIDVVPAGYKYNLHQYLRDFKESYKDILNRGKLPVICGGSGMYIETALSGVSLPSVPENIELRATLQGKSLEELTKILSELKTLHNITDVDTVKRAIRAIEIQYYYINHPEEAIKAEKSNVSSLNSLIIALDIDRETRRDRISSRLRSRIDAGMLDEIRRLLESGIPAEDLIYYGLEYKYLTLYLTRAISYEEMFLTLEREIHRFAKRQMTWLRGMERRGFKLHWLPYNMPSDEMIDVISTLEM